MTPRELIRVTAGRFQAAGIPDPGYDSALLLSYLCGEPPLKLRLDTETELSPGLLKQFENLAARRLRREPLQYLLGESWFCGRRFRVDRRVLIPRPETELLCEWALEAIAEVPSPRVLDVCTGSGCIGLTLGAERPDARITLTDLSVEALQAARENAQVLGVNVRLIQSDLLGSVPKGEKFDLILSNPPYIPTAECRGLQEEVLREPVMALDGGEDGLDFYRRLASDVPAFLFPGSSLMAEAGAGEAEAILCLLKEAGFTGLQVRKDLAGIDRMIRAIRP